MSRISALEAVPRRTMYGANLNAAYSLRILFIDYEGPHVRAKRNGDIAETDMSFDSKVFVFEPADWAFWSLHVRS